MRRVRRTVTVAVTATVTALAAATLPGPWIAVTPGPVFDTVDVVADATAGRFTILTVLVEERSLGAGLVGVLRGDRLLPRPADLDAYIARAETDAASSASSARTAAAALTGTPAAAVTVSGFAGPSAGLAMTLALVDAAADGDLSAGRVVAASATIDADGSTGPVGGIAEKVTAASAGGVTVLFVDEADRAIAVDAAAGTGIVVVAVDHAADAVAWLCATATDPVCP